MIYLEVVVRERFCCCFWTILNTESENLETPDGAGRGKDVRSFRIIFFFHPPSSSPSLQAWLSPRKRSNLFLSQADGADLSSGSEPVWVQTQNKTKTFWLIFTPLVSDRPDRRWAFFFLSGFLHIVNEPSRFLQFLVFSPEVVLHRNHDWFSCVSIYSDYRLPSERRPSLQASNGNGMENRSSLVTFPFVSLKSNHIWVCLRHWLSGSQGQRKSESLEKRLGKWGETGTK